MSEEMKACPFCGSEIAVVPFLDHSGQIYAHPVNECLLSGCHVPAGKLRQWNTRTPSANREVVEAAKAVGSALDDWIRIVAVRSELNPDLRHYVWKRQPTYDEVQDAMNANNALRAAIDKAQAALSAMPDS